MPSSAAPIGPWFRRHPKVAAIVAGGLFVAITVAQFVVGDERDAIGLLFSLPVALLALAFGQWAGLGAAAVGVALVSAWSVADDAAIGVTGWVARVVPLALLGLLVGRAADEQRTAEADRLRLAVAETHRRDAAEINDLIVQRVAAARWSIEAGRTEAALEELQHVMEVSQRLVADLLADHKVAERMRSRRPPATWEDLA